jgi:hypothetical protein
MTIYFRQVAQVTSRADYEKILRRALSQSGSEAFHYLDTFKFDTKEAPLVLVGDIGKPLLEDLKKASPKATYAKGTCQVNEQNQVNFEVTAGKLSQRVMTSALKAAGIKSEISFQGGDDEGQGPTEPPTGTPQISELGQQWQSKVKVLRPAFEEVLRKARLLTNSSWADDLDGMFSQMLQEAKAGQFDAAMKSMALIARMMKSEEAARAEVKHQTNRALDSDYAESTKASAEQVYGKEVAEFNRQSMESIGQGMTEDGLVAFAKEVSKAEWKQRYVDPMLKAFRMIDRLPDGLGDLVQLSSDATRVLTQALQHAREADGRLAEREGALTKLEDAQNLYEGELAKFNVVKTSVRSVPELGRACKDLIEAALKARPSKGKSEPTPAELEDFEKAAQERKAAREKKILRLGQDIKEIKASIIQFEQVINSGSIGNPEELKRRRNALEVAEERLKKMVQGHQSGATEKEAYAEFLKDYRWPPAVRPFVKVVMAANALIDNHQLVEAESWLYDHMGEAFDLNTIDSVDYGSAEGRLYSNYRDLVSDLRSTYTYAQASVQKVKQCAKEALGYAQTVDQLLK